MRKKISIEFYCRFQLNIWKSKFFLTVRFLNIISSRVRRTKNIVSCQTLCQINFCFAFTKNFEKDLQKYSAYQNCFTYFHLKKLSSARFLEFQSQILHCSKMQTCFKIYSWKLFNYLFFFYTEGDDGNYLTNE